MYMYMYMTTQVIVPWKVQFSTKESLIIPYVCQCRIKSVDSNLDRQFVDSFQFLIDNLSIM